MMKAKKTVKLLESLQLMRLSQLQVEKLILIEQVENNVAMVSSMETLNMLKSKYLPKYNTYGFDTYIAILNYIKMYLLGGMDLKTVMRQIDFAIDSNMLRWLLKK